MTQINQDQINIGNQSALDLVTKTNEAKANLAGNLNGLGIEANAYTETLEQLVNKVSDISNENLIAPACFYSSIQYDDSNHQKFKLSPNKQLIAYYRNYERNVAIAKREDFFNPSFSTVFSTSYDTITPLLYVNNSNNYLFNWSPDGTKFVMFRRDSGVITIYDVVYGDSPTITLNKTITATGLANPNYEDITIIVSPDNNKMLITINTTDSYFTLYCADISVADGQIVPINTFTGLDVATSSVPFASFIDDNNIVGFGYGRTSTNIALLKFAKYSIDWTNFIFTRTTDIHTYDILVPNQYSGRYLSEIKTVNDKQYCFILGSSYHTVDNNLIVYNITDDTVMTYRSGIAGTITLSNSTSFALTIQSLQNNQFAVFSGMSCVPIIFDNQMNLISNNAVKNLATSLITVNNDRCCTLVNMDGTKICYLNRDDFHLRTVYLNKKVLFKRTLTENTVYYPASVTEQDIINGKCD